jgi:transcriptional regulator with XRE-family HTH domain
MSRADLAAAPGVSYNAIKDLEHGNRWPTWQTLASCCAVLDIVIQHEIKTPKAAVAPPPTPAPLSDPSPTVRARAHLQEKRR